MDKRVVIISASLRNDSNSKQLAEAFAKGAAAAGNETEIISLAGKRMGFCTGCLSCQKTFRCYMQDDAAVIAEKNKKCGCGGICYSDLLLRDKRTAENTVGPVQSHIPTGIQVQGCISSYGGSR